MAQYSQIQKYISPNYLLRRVLLGSAFAAMLATAGCGNSPPSASYGPDLSTIEMMAVRGDPYAIATLKPWQRQRVWAYQASHPGSVPTWGRDAVNVGMGAGAGYVAGSTMSSAARGGAAVTTGAAAGEAATLAPEAAEVGEAATAVREVAAVGEVGAAIGEAAAVGEAVETAAVIGEAAEGAGLLELLFGLFLFPADSSEVAAAPQGSP